MMKGRMISGSKSQYFNSHPDHVAIYNANLITEDGERVWWGDLDLTLDEKWVRDLAARSGSCVMVLRESDWGGAANGLRPLIDRFVICATATETIVGLEYTRRIGRDQEGRLVYVK